MTHNEAVNMCEILVGDLIAGAEFNLENELMLKTLDADDLVRVTQMTAVLASRLFDGLAAAISQQNDEGVAELGPSDLSREHQRREVLAFFAASLRVPEAP